MRGSVTGCLLLICVVTLLAEQAEGHIAFFSPKEMRELREKEGRKDADSRAEGLLVDETSPEEDGGDLTPIEIGLKLTAKKSHIGSAFGKMLQNIVEEPDNEN
ncbi:motilin-like [Danio aesculapii]|uniref:motilin-like n=1 Tax=Danio aesculapii TaxID=1142201 RepID=UPI0024C00F1B|nr:motilin-like [Danio aesculapii]XP_056301959.1 motilin-like [Danio aesculapii]XP_056301960.1 motilin-like [Danio aesculapii]